MEQEGKELYGEIEIGEDRPQVEAKICKVEDYKVEEVNVKDRIAKKIKLLVKHPDINDRLIEVSGAKYEQGDKIKVAGLWHKLDSDGKIPYHSSIAHVLRKYSKTNLKSMKGVEIETVNDDSGYLVVKAY